MPEHATPVAPTEALSLRDSLRQILTLALPIIGGMVSQNLVNLVDTAMVGQLENSAVALGAVGFGGMASWLASAFFMGLGSGVQAIAARRVGQGNRAGAMQPVHTALIVVVLIVVPYAMVLSGYSRPIYELLSDDLAVIEAGTPYLSVRLAAVGFVIANFSFRGYWNGIGRTTIYLRTILTMHAVNIFLNWVLIYGHLGFDAMGVLGAGIASAVAVGVGTFTYVVLALVHVRRDFLALPTQIFTTTRTLLQLSIPAGVQNVFFSLGFVVFFVIAQLLGTRELAATNVLVNLNLVCILPALGFGIAAATLVGQALGRGAKADAARWGWRTVGVACVSMTGLGGVLAIWPEFWLSLLMNDPIAEEMAVLPLIIVGCLQPIDAIGVVFSQALIGAGAVRTVMVASFVLQWGLFIPATFVWGVSMGGGLLALWLALVIWRSLFSGVMVLAWRRGKWKEIRV